MRFLSCWLDRRLDKGNFCLKDVVSLVRDLPETLWARAQGPACLPCLPIFCGRQYYQSQRGSPLTTITWRCSAVTVMARQPAAALAVLGT